MGEVCLCKIIFVAIQKTFVVIRQHKNRHPYLQYTNKAKKTATIYYIPNVSLDKVKY